MEKTIQLHSNLPLNILPQPDETTCGPTCLQTIYEYYGDRVPLSDLIKEVKQLKDGGTYTKERIQVKN